MARLARVIAPGMPHHVTQRGNRGQETFFGEEDYQHYLELMAQFYRAEQVAIWAYCLMPNHVHLIVVPQSAESLRRAIGEAHRRYTRRINFREGWRGYLWQGRFASFLVDEDHLLTAARYVELNPVRARSVQAPSRYRWSSEAAHLRGRDDVLVQVAPLLQMAPNWRRLLTSAIREGAGVVAISLVVMCSTFISLNGDALTGPRAYFAMARDGLLPRSLCRVHPRFCTPANAVLAQ